MTDREQLEKSAMSLAKKLGVHCELIPHSESAAKTNDAIKTLDEQAERVLKCLICIDKNTGKNVGAIVSGNTKLDFKALQNVTAYKKIQMAKPEYIYKLTGFEIGGVPPIVIAKCEQAVICETVFKQPYVIGAGGHDHCGMKIDPKEFKNIPNIQIALISK